MCCAHYRILVQLFEICFICHFSMCLDDQTVIVNPWSRCYNLLTHIRQVCGYKENGEYVKRRKDLYGIICCSYVRKLNVPYSVNFIIVVLKISNF